MPPGVRYKDFGQLSFWDQSIYEKIPPHPFWDQVNQLVDFSFADELCAFLYSSAGQRPYAPSLKLKIHLIQRYYNLSDREAEERIIGDLFLKRFLGLPVDHAGFDHSTIALDRSRMGSDLFDACFHHILEQARAKGLWGAKEDFWLIDSFHTHAHIAVPHAYGLVQQGVQRLVGHLKRKHPTGYERLQKDLDLSEGVKRLPLRADKPMKRIAFSRLMVTAYGLLAWWENAALTWDSEQDAQKGEALKALLHRILRENVKQADPPASPPSASSGRPPHADGVVYEERSRKEKPADRIVSAHDPELRRGQKGNVFFTGDKVQMLVSSSSGLVLNAEPIPGNEADGKRLVDIVQAVVAHHGVTPAATVGDTAYAYGPQRKAMKDKQMALVGPTPEPARCTGLFANDQFRYDPEADRMTCPAGATSVRRAYNRAEAGTQHFFDARTCAACSLRTLCTNATTAGRSVFRSDYHDLMQEAKAYNQTPAGQAALSRRKHVERKNNEAKNHHGLNHPRTRGREPFRIAVKVTAMVMNLKVFVKAFGRDTDHFLRYPSRRRSQAPVCP